MTEASFWMVPRPKRRLTSVPRILSAWVLSARELELHAPDEVWRGNRERHIRFEETLEFEGLKRPGKRRDGGGSGGRTYAALLKALGLIFSRADDERAFLTLAGEALVASDSNPKRVLTTQIARFQYPSSYSVSRGVRISDEFHVRPLLLILQLLMDARIKVLTEDEIGRVVARYGVSNSQRTVDDLAKRILARRQDPSAGFSSSADLWRRQLPSPPIDYSTTDEPTKPERRAITTANVLANWLDYTQLISRDEASLWIPDYHRNEAARLVETHLSERLIQRPKDEEYFQRRFGRGPDRLKDTRDLDRQTTVTAKKVEEALLRTRYLALAERSPLTGVSDHLVATLAESSGVSVARVEEFLRREYPVGSFDLFLSEYIQMAYESRARASDFELATAEMLSRTFGLKAEHTGVSGKREPDVVIRHGATWGVFDNKAYRAYSLPSSDERAMLEYLERYQASADETGASVGFYTYIAAGFTSGVEPKLAKITRLTGIPGSAVDVETMAYMAKIFEEREVPLASVLGLFASGKRVTRTDVDTLVHRST